MMPDLTSVEGLNAGVFGLAVALIVIGLGLRMKPFFAAFATELAEAGATMPPQEAFMSALGRVPGTVPEMLVGDPAALEKKLRAAGRPFGLAAMPYRLMQFRFSILIGVVAAIAMLIAQPMNQMTIPGAFSLGIGGFGIIWVLVDAGLQQTASVRAVQISRQLPYYLDLSLLVVQAGGRPVDAVDLYMHVFGDTALADELDMLREEHRTLRFGQALERLRERASDEAVQNIIGNLAQSEKVGAKLEDSLMEQAYEIRALRSELAERAAEKLNAKFRLPMVLMLVAVLMVILSPAVVGMMDSGFL